MFRGLHPAVTSFALAPMLLLSAMAHAQSKAPSPKAAGDAGGFSAKGLNYETELTALYLGDFAHSRLQRDGHEFDFLFGNYLKAFARRCSAYLPPNKVEMMRTECAREQYTTTTNRYGTRTSAPVCVEYRQVGTGLYADPELYAAQQKVEAEVGQNMLRSAVRDMSAKNPMQTGMRAVDAATSVGRDMDSLLELNSCTSPGLKRFQDNMMRFALGQPPLHLPGGETLASIAPKKSPDAPFKDSNYSRLVDDLIAENAQGWMLNRYVRGSASGVTVSSRDAQGRPSKIVGSYSFDSANGRRQGSVTVQFSDGLPQCVFFFDFPTTCRTPSRRIITAYENGRYRDQ